MTYHTNKEHVLGLADMMAWRGEWAAGAYKKGDVVTDSAWTMVANKDTSALAAPQPVGGADVAPTYPVPPGFTTETALVTNSHTIVQRYLIPADASAVLQKGSFFVSAVDPSLYYEFTLVSSADTDPQRTLLGGYFADVIGWKPFYPGAKILLSSGAFDIEVSIFRPGGGFPVTFSGNWSYAESSGVPGSGYLHQSGSGGYIRVSYTDADADGFNWENELNALTVGDTITAKGVGWGITAVVAGGEDYATFIVLPTTHIASGLTLVTFENFPSVDTHYAKLADHFSGTPELRGGVGASYTDAVTNLGDDAFGVQVELQPMQASPDWDKLAYSGILVG